MVPVCAERGQPISIHVPREGHDEPVITNSTVKILFLSTCPVRGTTLFKEAMKAYTNISIHVPREGHDRLPGGAHREPYNFYPRAP